MTTIEIITKDEISTKVSRDVMTQSLFIKDLLEDQEEQQVHLPGVDSKILEKVIAYLTHHKDNKATELEKPLKNKLEDSISKWDKEFLEMDQPTLLEVIMAANYLNIKDLLELTCAKVADMIKGKTPQQIRDMFGIENDFTPEEEEKIREENKWAEQ